MLYSDSDKIKETEFVVLDEVHYVNDRDVICLNIIMYFYVTYTFLYREDIFGNKY